MASLVAGTAGITLTLDPLAGQTGNITTLTGWTVNLVAIYPDDVTRKSFACTVNTGGLTASYTTGATDFAIDGTYQLQLDATNGAQSLASAPLAVTFAKKL